MVVEGMLREPQGSPRVPGVLAELDAVPADAANPC